MPRHISLHADPTNETALMEAAWQLQAARSDKVVDALGAWAEVKQAIALERIADALESRN